MFLCILLVNLKEYFKKKNIKYGVLSIACFCGLKISINFSFADAQFYVWSFRNKYNVLDSNTMREIGSYYDLLFLTQVKTNKKLFKETIRK